MKIISRIQGDLIIYTCIFLVDVGNQLFHKCLDAAQNLAECKSIGGIESEEVTRAS